MSPVRSLSPSELDGTSVWLIPLTQGKFAVIDKQDGWLVIACNWHANHSKKENTWYASTHVRNSKRILKLHKLIGEAMGIAGPVDHKNGDGLDCRRSNLRPGPDKLNQANQRKLQTRTASSKYKGVSWCSCRRKWEVYLRENGKKRHIGYFALEDEDLAARAYDRAALAAWGTYARLNFPQLTTA